MPDKPLVIAHRGASGQRPENTLAAYELAIEMGADMIEIDLHHTRDRDVVVTHDATPRHAGADREVRELSLDEVRALDAGDGERIPTLDEVLDRFGERIAFNLEIKHSDAAGRYEGLEEQALRALHERSLLGRTLFSSFYEDVLVALRSRDPEARLALLLSPRAAERPIERARKVGAEAVNPHFILATADFVREAHDNGFAVNVYTVDAEAEMHRLIDLQVDGIFTNHPDRLLAILGRG